MKATKKSVTKVWKNIGGREGREDEKVPRLGRPDEVDQDAIQPIYIAIPPALNAELPLKYWDPSIMFCFGTYAPD